MIDFDVDRARRLKQSSAISWAQLAKKMGTTVETLRRAIDPGYAEKKAASVRKLRAKQPPGMPKSRLRQDSKFFVAPEDEERVLATIPLDTRDFTARVLGDPVKERSALYLKQNGKSP